MNPQTRKNPLDSAKYREQYLSNLRLESSNNQRNQNANMIFKNTGMTPSRPPDMRTTTERAGDVEALKVELRSKLGTITDGVIASQIIGELDTDQIRFAIDNWITITEDMKRMFAGGVPSSAFIAYLNRLIQKFQLTEGVETGLQQSAGNAILLSNTQLLSGLPREQIWGALDNILVRIQNTFGFSVGELRDRMRETASLVPTKQEQEIVATLPFKDKAEVMKLATEIYNNFPSNQSISDIVGELNIGLANRDRRYTEQTLGSLLSIVTTEPSVIDQMADLRGFLSDFVDKQEGNRIADQEAETGFSFDDGGFSFNEDGGISFNDGGFSFNDNEMPNPNVNPTRPPETTFEEIAKSIGQTPQTKGEPTKVPRIISRSEWTALGTRKKEAKSFFLNERLSNNPDLVLEGLKGKEYGLSISRRGTKVFSSDKNTNADLDAAYDSYMAQTNLGMSGEGSKRMSGKGLIDKPYRQSISHLIDKPIDKPKPYTPFGRYYINKHRLEGEGIIAFRQPSGNTIGTLPTEKISKTFSKVIRTLVGKGIPSYEDIGELTKSEQNKLYHICKVCQINNPAVPKMKGSGEKEDDRFEILRGEIIAGNDNQTLIKEFKIMLMKFMNEGRIPRRQANEILQEILSMGH